MAPPQRTVKVTGTSTTKVVPDQLLWTITIRERNEQLQAAHDAVRLSTDALMQLVKDFEIPAQDVQTGCLEVERTYRRSDYQDVRSFTGFEVRREARILLRDFKRFDDFVLRLVTIGNVEMSYEMSHSDMTTIRANTRLAAAREAQKKAQALCEELGATLGEIITIEEGSQALRGRTISASNSYVSESVPTGYTSGTLAEGQVSYTVSVETTFAIK